MRRRALLLGSLSSPPLASSPSPPSTLDQESRTSGFYVGHPRQLPVYLRRGTRCGQDLDHARRGSPPRRARD